MSGSGSLESKSEGRFWQINFRSQQNGCLERRVSDWLDSLKKSSLDKIGMKESEEGLLGLIVLIL